jgi:hypothetical protein
MGKTPHPTPHTLPPRKTFSADPNCCWWGEPEKYSGRGRPKKHGDKFKLNDSTSGMPSKQLKLKTQN